MMEKSDVLLIATLQGWDLSAGISHEVETFAAADKPVLYVDPKTLEITP